MIKYDDNGVIIIEKLTSQDCYDYLMLNEAFMGKIDTVTVNGIKEDFDIFHPDTRINYCFKIKEINRLWNEGTKVHYSAISCENARIGYKIDPDTFHFCIQENVLNGEVYNLMFKCNDLKSFNLCVICLRYMDYLNECAFEGNEWNLNADSYKEKIQNGKSLSEEKDADFLKQIELEKEKIKTEKSAWSGMDQDDEKTDTNKYKNDYSEKMVVNITPEHFFANHKCSRCGNIGHWKSIYGQKNGFVKAQCTICEHYECTYMKDDGTEDLQKKYALEKEIEEDNRKEGRNYLNQKAPWEDEYFNYPCPYCGKYKVRYSKWEDKQFSTAFWGVFSRKLHSRFKCDNCKEMWN